MARLSLPVFPVGRAGIQLTVRTTQASRYVSCLFIDNAWLRDDLNQESLIVGVPFRSGFTLHITGTGNNHLAREVIELKRRFLLIGEPELEERQSPVVAELVIEGIVIFLGLTLNDQQI